MPVLPFALSARAGIPKSEVQQWVSILLAAYAAGLVVCSPICGYYADRSDSRRTPFMLGLLALAGANLMLCFGSSIAVLLVGRFLQGCAAAVVWAVGFAMAPETMGTEKAGLAVGFLSLGINLGVLIGPTIGGVVFAKAGYFAVFAMTFGLLGLDFFLRAVMIERKVALQILQEVQGSRESSEGEAGETDALMGANRDGAQSKYPQSTPHPFPIFLFLRSHRFLAALWGILVLAIMLTAFDRYAAASDLLDDCHRGLTMPSSARFHCL